MPTFTRHDRAYPAVSSQFAQLRQERIHAGQPYLVLEREDGWHMAGEKADYARVRTHLLVGVTSSSLAVAAATTFIALARC